MKILENALISFQERYEEIAKPFEWKFTRNDLKKLIATDQQNTLDIDGFYYENPEGGQMVFWTCYSDRISKEHRHDFDEYMICVKGQYTAVLEGKEIVLCPGDELYIPRGTRQSGRCNAGTRTVHAFGGRRTVSNG